MQNIHVKAMEIWKIYREYMENMDTWKHIWKICGKYDEPIFGVELGADRLGHAHFSATPLGDMSKFSMGFSSHFEIRKRWSHQRKMLPPRIPAAHSGWPWAATQPAPSLATLTLLGTPLG